MPIFMRARPHMAGTGAHQHHGTKNNDELSKFEGRKPGSGADPLHTCAHDPRPG